MAIMWSVPFDYNFYVNMHAMGVYDNKPCNKELFNMLYYSENMERFGRFHADNTRKTYTDDDIIITCKMTDCCEPTLIIEVTNNENRCTPANDLLRCRGRNM